MNKIFNRFITTFDTIENRSLIESIRDGYRLIFENSSEYHSLVTFKGRDGYDQVKDIVSLFKSKHGLVIVDPDSTSPNVHKIINYGCSLEFSKSDLDEKRLNSYSIKIESNNESNVHKCAKLIASLIFDLGAYGNSGHSYAIKFVPDASNGKTNIIGWDGDGSDFIDLDNIQIDDNPFDPNNDKSSLYESDTGSDTYEIPRIEPTKSGNKTITTNIPPEKRTWDNIPKKSDGHKLVKFQDWLCIDTINYKNGTIGKGSDGKWYGWSHRAVYGFEIGDKIKKGDVVYNGNEYTIKTEQQAKDTAAKFSDSVS